MFIALYRWKVLEGHEDKFQEAWHRRTGEIYERLGSLGSRLHRAEDGTWFAYAQWPDKATWEAAWKTPTSDVETQAMFRASIEQAFPDIYMTVVDDLLQQEPAN